MEELEQTGFNKDTSKDEASINFMRKNAQESCSSGRFVWALSLPTWWVSLVDTSQDTERKDFKVERLLLESDILFKGGE